MRIMAAVFLLTVVGCASVQKDASSVAAGMESEYDAHMRRCLVYTRPVRQFGEGWPIAAAMSEWWLRAQRFEDSVSWRYSLRIGVMSDDWRFFKAAWSEGEMLDMREVDSSVGSCSPYSCSVLELFEISLTPAQIQDYAIRGLSFEMVGRGSEVVTIPAHYFGGFLEGMKASIEDCPTTAQATN